jgi:hypothetical protein
MSNSSMLEGTLYSVQSANGGGDTLVSLTFSLVVLRFELRASKARQVLLFYPL